MSDSVTDITSKVQRRHGSLVEENPSKPEYQVGVNKGFGLLEKLRGMEHKSQLLLSWLLTFAFFTMGLTMGQVGSTLTDLQIITGTDLERASAFLTGHNGGYMAGALFSGVVFNKINARLLMFLALFVLGAVSIILPYCSIYPLMIFIRTLSGMCCGTISASANTLQMKMWRSEGKVLMQIMHFAYALGGVVSVLYTEPFLAKRITTNETVTDNVTIANSSDLHITSDPRTTNVQYAFFVSGVFLILASIPFIVLLIKQRSPNFQNKQDQVGNINITYRKLPLCFHVFILTTLCILILLYCCVEFAFSSFLMSFLINEFYFMTTSEIAYIFTVYWLSFALSRFIMIFVTNVLSSARLLSLCILLMLLAFTGFFISILFGVIVPVVVFTAMAGLGMSSVFPAAFSWAETELLRVTAQVSAIICIVSAVGAIVSPLILGFLMDEVSNRWFCYLLLGQSAVMCLIFMFLFLFNRLFINKVYGSLIGSDQYVVDNGMIVKGEYETLM